MDNLKEIWRTICEWWQRDNYIRAAQEVFFVGLMSLLPLLLSAIFADMKDEDMTVMKLLGDNISNGELFLYSVSFIASAFFVAADDPPWKQKDIAGRAWITLVSILVLCTSCTFIVMQRRGSFADTDAVTNWSSWVFAASLLMLFMTCSFRNNQVSPPKIIKNTEDDFLNRFVTAQGEER